MSGVDWRLLHYSGCWFRTNTVHGWMHAVPVSIRMDVTAKANQRIQFGKPERFSVRAQVHNDLS